MAQRAVDAGGVTRWRGPDEDPASASCLPLLSLKNGIAPRMLGFVSEAREQMVDGSGNWGSSRGPPTRVDKKNDWGRFLSLPSGEGCGDASFPARVDANLTQN